MQYRGALDLWVLGDKLLSVKEIGGGWGRLRVTRCCARTLRYDVHG